MKNTTILPLIIISLYGCNTLTVNPEVVTESAVSAAQSQSPTVQSDLPEIVEALNRDPVFDNTLKEQSLADNYATYAYLNHGFYDDPTETHFLHAAPDEAAQAVFSSASTEQIRINPPPQLNNPPPQPVQRHLTTQNNPQVNPPIIPKVLDTSEKFKRYQSTNTSQNLWDRIRKGYNFAVVDNAYTQRALEKYLQHTRYFDNLAIKAAPYLHYIVEQVEKRKLPLEIALLPAIESGFEPLALSPKSAAGIWQFIPSTGRDYGLTQTEEYDARRDLMASTQAALNYLERLHDLFDNDWFLALAAYNYGEGNVRKAIRKNEAEGKPTDYWSLSLPGETRWYVPKLLAVTKVIANPEQYRIQLRSIPNRPYLTQIEVNRQMSLAIAAKLADLTPNDFRNLNAGYRLGITTPPHKLTIPIHKLNLFKQQLAKANLPPPIPLNSLLNNPQLLEEQTVALYDQPPTTPGVLVKEETPLGLLETTRYQVRKGDTLGLLAQRYQISKRELQQLNNLSGHILKVGQFLTVPMQSTVSTEESTPDSKEATAVTVTALSVPNEPKKDIPKTAKHRVRRGDTLDSIAQHYQTTVAQLRQLNRLQGRYLIAGQTLKVPELPTPTAQETTLAIVDPQRIEDPVAKQAVQEQAVAIKPLGHRVRKGEVLSEIARQHATNVSTLRSLNQLSGNTIKVGQILLIPDPQPQNPTPVPTAVPTVAQAGSSDSESSPASPTPDTTEELAEDKKKVIHTVKSGDSLWEIARDYQVSVEKLNEWNQLTTGSLQLGQKLTIWQEGA